MKIKSKSRTPKPQQNHGHLSHDNTKYSKPKHILNIHKLRIKHVCLHPY